MHQQLIRQIGELDVFALLVFRTIFESGHANLAAKHLDVSAPKISRSLNSLRQTFADELFYRRAQGLKATPLAEQLYPIVCQLTDSVAALGLCAHSAKQELHSPSIQLAIHEGLLAPLALAMTGKALSNSYRLLSWQDKSHDLIHCGDLDMGVCLDPNQHPELNYEALGSTPPACLVARDAHPLWQTSAPTLEQLCEYPFINASSSEPNCHLASLVLFCQREAIAAPQQLNSHTKDEWYANLLLTESVALVSRVEQSMLAPLPGLRVQALSEAQVERLNTNMQLPKLYLVEKPKRYRRYNEQQRVEVIDLIQCLLQELR